MAMLMKVRSSRKTKNNAIRKFTALCEYYNIHSKMLDIVKEMLERGMWEKGDAIKHSETVEALGSLAHYAQQADASFIDARDKVGELLKEVKREKEQGAVCIHPVDLMRISEMKELAIYLIELEKEVANILHEVNSVLTEIENIENN